MFIHTYFFQEKIANRKEAGMTVLRTAMAYLSLRRRKETVASTVQLVDRKVNVVAVEFEEGEHKNVHDVLYNSGKRSISVEMSFGSRQKCVVSYSFLLFCCTARALLGNFFEYGDEAVLANYMTFIALVLRSTCCQTMLQKCVFVQYPYF
jgi:hypothetical protein